MLIEIKDNTYVILKNKTNQKFNTHAEVYIDKQDRNYLYKVGFNDYPTQEINNGLVEFPMFTNHDKSVIIKVEITQMGSVIKTLYSDEYPLRLLPFIGRTLDEQFPVTLERLIRDNSKFKEGMLDNFLSLKEQLIKDNSKFKEDLLDSFLSLEERLKKTLEEYKEVLEKLENEGEIV